MELRRKAEANGKYEELRRGWFREGIQQDRPADAAIAAGGMRECYRTHSHSSKNGDADPMVVPVNKSPAGGARRIVRFRQRFRDRKGKPYLALNALLLSCGDTGVRLPNKPWLSSSGPAVK